MFLIVFFLSMCMFSLTFPGDMNVLVGSSSENTPQWKALSALMPANFPPTLHDACESFV